MSRSHVWTAGLAVSLALNLLLVAGVAALAASGSVADRVAPRLHLASTADVAQARAEGIEAQRRIGGVQGTSTWSWERRGTVADALSELDSRLAGVEEEIGSSSELIDLSSRIDELERTTDDLSGTLDDACFAIMSLTRQSIGTDAFYAFLDLQRAFC
jgi:hypothetical protein